MRTRLTAVFVYTNSRFTHSSQVPTWANHLRNTLNSHDFFMEFLISINYDHSLLLDFLISNETHFLPYFLNYLRHLANDWSEFIEAVERRRVLSGEEMLQFYGSVQVPQENRTTQFCGPVEYFHGHDRDGSVRRIVGDRGNEDGGCNGGKDDDCDDGDSNNDGGDNWDILCLVSDKANKDGGDDDEDRNDGDSNHDDDNGDILLVGDGGNEDGVCDCNKDYDCDDGGDGNDDNEHDNGHDCSGVSTDKCDDSNLVNVHGRDGDPDNDPSNHDGSVGDCSEIGDDDVGDVNNDGYDESNGDEDDIEDDIEYYESSDDSIVISEMDNLQQILTCLIRLRYTVERMSSKGLFPYPVTALIKVMKYIESLYEGEG